MFAVQATPGTVLCCLCGLAIPPNPANMCANCIRSQVRFSQHRRVLLRALRCCRWEHAAETCTVSQVDITEGIQKQCTVLWCKECNRWLQARICAAAEPKRCSRAE